MARTDIWSMEHQRAIPKWFFALVIVTLAGRIVSHYYPPKSHDDATSMVKWIAIAQAPSRAHGENKPILYDFSAEWCRPCHMMDAAVFEDATLGRKISRSLIAVRVIDRQQEDGRNPPDVEALQRRYRVRAFPTVIIADASGNELARMEGFKGRAEFEAMVRPFLK